MMTWAIVKYLTGMHFFVVDTKTAKKFLAGKNKRVVCTFDDRSKIHAAILTKKELGHYIRLGKSTVKKLKVKPGDKIKVSITEDTTPFQFEMPEELAEVLATDPLANDVFKNLSPGNQRSIIYLVSLLKSTDKRIERAMRIAEKLKAGITSARKMIP
jgi:hypothetical protein